MNESKLKELLSDEKFADKIMAMEEPEDAQKAFKEEGLELTIEEVKLLGEAFAKAAEGKELSEEDLDNVAGGTGAICFGVVTGVIGIAGFGCSWADRIAGRDWWKRW